MRPARRRGGPSPMRLRKRKKSPFVEKMTSAARPILRTSQPPNERAATPAAHRAATASETQRAPSRSGAIERLVSTRYQCPRIIVTATAPRRSAELRLESTATHSGVVAPEPAGSTRTRTAAAAARSASGFRLSPRAAIVTYQTAATRLSAAPASRTRVSDELGHAAKAERRALEKVQN